MSVKLSKSLPHKSLRYCTLRIRAWRLFATIPLPTLVERAGSSILKPSVDTIRGILTIYQGWLEGGEAEENMAWILWIIICEFPHYLSWITTHLYFCFFLVKLVCLLPCFSDHPLLLLVYRVDSIQWRIFLKPVIKQWVTCLIHLYHDLEHQRLLRSKIKHVFIFLIAFVIFIISFHTLSLKNEKIWYLSQGINMIVIGELDDNHQLPYNSK